MINTKQQLKNNQKQTIMKKKIIGAIVLCALAIIATIGINLNTHTQNSRLDLMLENVPFLKPTQTGNKFGVTVRIKLKFAEPKDI